MTEASALHGIWHGGEMDISSQNPLVPKPVWSADPERLHINDDTYIAPVPKPVWEFHIGGYQVLDKYLKSRKGRTLSLDEINTIFAIVKALAFTVEQMVKIEEV